MGFVYVGVGGVCGALLRYQLSKWIGERFVVSFPLATLLINITGSFLLGLFTRELGNWLPLHHMNQGMLLLGTGLCGAYTTFSTFSYETTMLLREGRNRTAMWYIGGSFVFGFVAAGLGLYGFPTLS